MADPHVIGPSLYLYLSRWEEMQALDSALDDESVVGVDDDVLGKAQAVVDTANARVMALLDYVWKHGLERPTSDRLRLERPRNWAAAARDEWWSGKILARRRGRGRQRCIGSLELSAVEDPALDVYFQFPGAESKHLQDGRTVAFAAQCPSADFWFDTEEGTGTYLTKSFPFEPGTTFSELAAAVADWTRTVVIDNLDEIADLAAQS